MTNKLKEYFGDKENIKHITYLIILVWVAFSFSRVADNLGRISRGINSLGGMDIAVSGSLDIENSGSLDVNNSGSMDIN